MGDWGLTPVSGWWHQLTFAALIGTRFQTWWWWCWWWWRWPRLAGDFWHAANWDRPLSHLRLKRLKATHLSNSRIVRSIFKDIIFEGYHKDLSCFQDKNLSDPDLQLNLKWESSKFTSAVSWTRHGRGCVKTELNCGHIFSSSNSIWMIYRSVIFKFNGRCCVKTELASV